MREVTETCASCKEFPLDETGKAPCALFERQEQWDNRACVLYTRTSDIQSRRPLVAKLHQQNNNGVIQ